MIASERLSLSGPRLSDVDGSRDNNMDFVRFVAASMVIYAHAFNLRNTRDPLESVTGVSSGELAVAVFFSLSGYLIARSLVNRGSLVEFVLARALRILPALIVANVLAVLAGALFCTDLSQGEYWSSGKTWRYLLMNSSLIKNSYELPGVFGDSVFGPAVNGSLWTLPVEARMYGLVFLAGLCALLFGKWARIEKVGWLVGIGSVGMLLSGGVWDLLGLPYGGALLGESGVKLLGIFSVGMVLQGLRDRVRLNGWVVVIGAAACFLVRDSWLMRPGFILWLPYMCLWLAYTNRLAARGFGKFGDMSYGIYVYAFPIQQWLYSIEPGMDPLWNAAVTFGGVLCLAAVSWRLIERPSLGLKRYLHERIDGGLSRIGRVGSGHPS